MVKKIRLGLIFGALAGLIDILPMLAMKLPAAANLSAFSLWVAAGFFIATSELKLNRVLKGLIVSLLIFLPNAFLIGQNNLAGLVPPLIMTVILGGLLGLVVGK